MQTEMEGGGEEPRAAVAALRWEEAVPPIWRTERDDGSWTEKQMDAVHSAGSRERDAFLLSRKYVCVCVREGVTLIYVLPLPANCVQ